MAHPTVTTISLLPIKKTTNRCCINYCRQRNRSAWATACWFTAGEEGFDGVAFDR